MFLSMLYITNSERAIATTTSKCDRHPLLVDAEIFERIPHGLRYKVQLASKLTPL